MVNRVIAKKQAFSLLVIFVLVLLFVLASAPIVQATGGGTIPEPIPDKPQADSSGDSISDPFLGLFLALMSLGLVL